jgi:hypothetical protein
MLKFQSNIIAAACRVKIYSFVLHYIDMERSVVRMMILLKYVISMQSV